MREMLPAVSLGEIFLVGLLLSLGYRIYRDRQRMHSPVVRRMLGAVALIIIWGIVMLPQPLQPWQRILAAFCAQYCVLLYYCALDQMLNSKRHRPIIRSKVFPITSLIVIAIVILDFHMGTYQPPLHSEGPSTLTAYAESALSYFGLLYLEVLIVWVYIQDLRQHTDLIYATRRSFCLLGFVLNILGLLSLEGSLLLSLASKNGYSIVISSIYSLYIVSLIIMAALVAGSYILPKSFFTKTLHPVYEYLTLRQKRQQELLRHLHQTMTQIVPSVQLDFKQMHDLRVLIEISDARRVIWSQELRTQSVTPREEANYLLHLINNHTVFDKPGEHSPVPVRGRDIVKHNVAVAKHLETSCVSPKRQQASLLNKEVYEQTIRLDPNSVLAYNNKATTLGQLGRHKEALATSEQIIRLDPNSGRGYSLKGTALMGLKRYNEANIAFEQASSLGLKESIYFSYIAQEMSKIRNPRRMGLAIIALLALALILFFILSFLGVSNTIMPIIFGIPGILGGLLFDITVIWLITLAVRRRQISWAIFLFFGCLITVPLYLIFNPAPNLLQRGVHRMQ